MCSLLVSTAHITVKKMHCLLTGNVQFSFSEFSGSCEGAEDACAVTEGCCAIHTIAFDMDYDSILNLEFVTQATFILLPAKVLLETGISTLNELYAFFTDLPPPSGLSLLKLIQVFRL